MSLNSDAPISAEATKKFTFDCQAILRTAEWRPIETVAQATNACSPFPAYEPVKIFALVSSPR